METLKNYFEKQLVEKQKTKFNIFSALHDDNDERYLHSRFIAYLLSADTKYLKSQYSHHGMENEFLKLFVQSVLKTDDFDCENYEVIAEYKDIDILVYNNEQAIIIENKIYAGDSNHLHRSDEYSGQLERYYNTIKKGIDKDGKESIKKEEVFIIYLTLGGNLPSTESLGKTLNLNDVRRIDYTNEITTWLTNCAKLTENSDEFLSETIIQYKELIKKLTSDINQAKENQEEISKKIEEAWELEKQTRFFTQRCKEVFKHVKWHTVADFINKLENALVEKEAITIEKTSAKTITSITHNNNRNEKLIIKFNLNNQEIQIVNDAKGFTLGNLTDGKWDYFSDDIKNIKFYDFSNEKTFEVINTTKREELMNKIVEFVEKNYQNLKNTFLSK